MQRLSRKGVGYKLTVLEAVSTLTSKVEGEDIVWTIWKHIDAGNAADIVLRTILNISWGDYAQFFINDLMQDKVAKSTKRVIFLAHTVDVMNELEQILETFIKLKGSIMNNGVEASFTTVLGTKKLPLRNLVGYENENLKITEDEEIDGFKYVYQTRLTKASVGERIRAPLGMWDRKETYIDNDLQIVLDRLDSYYADTSVEQ